MPTSTNVTNLKINELTEAQYDAAVQGGVIGANEISILTDAEAGQVIQVATLPTASADELGNIYQFIGTTDANYTNGYFYKCVSDGGNPATYSWSNVQVQASSGGLPSQTGNAGKFLTTDGTDASWATVNALQNTATGTNSLTIAGTATTTPGCVNIGFGSAITNNYSVAIGESSKAHITSVAVGSGAKSTGTSCVAIGTDAESSNIVSVAIGYRAKATSSGSIQIGEGTNSTTNSLSVGYNYHNYQLLDANGTVPSDRLVHAINKYSNMPTAASTNEGWIVQFTGTTDSTYTHGHLYECVSDGQNPATYSWTEVQLGGGGSSYTAGTGIDITSGVISVTSPTLQNAATGTSAIVISGTSSQNQCTVVGFGSTYTGWNASGGTVIGFSAKGNGNGTVCIGDSSKTTGNGGTVIGSSAEAGEGSCAIGRYAKTTAQGAIQLSAGGGNYTNSNANTFKVGNNTGNFEMMSADGTIPTDRYTTTPVADGTYVPTLTISSGVATRSWGAAASAPVVPATMPTLAVADWSSNTQTVNVTGVTASNIVFVSPAPASAADYAAAGIVCTAQGSGTLTFTCITVPSNAITVNVVILG